MQNDPMDHFSQTSMKILTQRMNQMVIGEKVRNAISDWYFENGKPEPLWYTKDPDWWTNYLNDIGEK
jgi:hypothetical protein